MKTVASAANIEIVEKSSPSKNSPDGFFHSTSSEAVDKAFEEKKRQEEKKKWYEKCLPENRCVIL
jgi:hypothetical protein